MSEREKTFLLRLAVLAILATGIGFLVWLHTPCLIREYLGVICPTCGMSRAWLAALRLDFVSAFRYHPVFWGVPALALAYLFDGKPFGSEKLGRWLYIIVLAGLLICYMVRLLMYLSGDLHI
ncbi:MAG: DUF2752 domain-containing protein [Faecousia sp.]